MGSGASLNVKDNEKLNEEGCRSIAAELFDLATFNALKDEEGNVIEVPPRECLTFPNAKDPEGRLGILAGLVMH